VIECARSAGRILMSRLGENSKTNEKDGNISNIVTEEPDLKNILCSCGMDYSKEESKTAN